MEMGGFGDGMPWENIPVRFPAVSALLGENQESLETLPKAVWSRDRAQLGFSELPAKTETSDSLSGLSWCHWGCAISTPAARAGLDS